jgi:hypothetical protein
MSAFVVSHDHIDALLTFAEFRRLDLSHIVRTRDLSKTGQLLLAENERSVYHRYPDCSGPDDLPGKIGEEAIGYRYRPFIGLMARLNATERIMTSHVLFEFGLDKILPHPSDGVCRNGCPVGHSDKGPRESRVP